MNIKTAAYTILKNEKQFIEKWLYYTEPFDYQVLLDTGSSDGSFELLQEYQNKYPNLILQQKTFTPWRFDVARQYNQSMIPEDVDWCLSPDLDEYFSINTLIEMKKLILDKPDVTNIACDRLDVYSHQVRVGPPNFLPTNKIHRKNDYTWVQPIYEHLSWIHKDRSEVEIYSPNIFLIHDQDFKKKERPEQYLSMLKEEYKVNPSNTWTLWYLVNIYYKNRDITSYLPAACDFIRYSSNKTEERYAVILNDIKNISNNIDSFTPEEINDEMRDKLKRTLDEAASYLR